MLDADLSGARYIKSQHSTALMARLGRSHRSVEFKHQNISAVLDELGLPWIPGYIPKSNYQNAIFGAIDRFLSMDSALLDLAPVERESVATEAVFVDPPLPRIGDGTLSKGLTRLVRKFDPVLRDHKNRALGKAGEGFVYQFERQRLVEANCLELAAKVRWVSAEDGDGAGYDVLSFDPSGEERFLEVKTTNGSARTPFFLSRNEISLALERPANWSIYRVHLFARSPRIFTISPPLEMMLRLQPESWRASFG